MLKKRCDLQAPSPLSSELANGGGGLLSPRSSSSSSSSLQGFSPRSIFSVDDQAKNHPCASPRNPLSGGGQVTGLAGVLVDGEGERRCYGRTGRVLLGMMRLRVQLPQERVLAELADRVRREEPGRAAGAALAGAAVAAVVGGGEDGAGRGGARRGLHLRHRPGTQPQDDPHIR